MTSQEQLSNNESAIINLLRGKTLEDLSNLSEHVGQQLDGAQRVAQQLTSGSNETVVEALREILSRSPSENEGLNNLGQFKAMARAHHVNTGLVRAALQADVPIWLHGEAGSGKSTSGEVAADSLNLAFRSISLGPTTSKSDLLGYRDATGGYHDTAFRRMYEDGGIFLFDEIDNAHPSILTLLNSAIANQTAEFPDARIERDEQTRFIATANTIGKGANADYVGRAPIDAATIDRFAFIPMDIDPNLEEALILGNGYTTSEVDISEGGVPDEREWLAVVRAHREAIGELGIRAIVSQRASLYGVKLAKQGVGKDWLEKMLIYKGMKEHDREKLATNAHRKTRSMRDTKGELLIRDETPAEHERTELWKLTEIQKPSIDHASTRWSETLYFPAKLARSMEALNVESERLTFEGFIELSWTLEEKYGNSLVADSRGHTPSDNEIYQLRAKQVHATASAQTPREFMAHIDADRFTNVKDRYFKSSNRQEGYTLFQDADGDYYNRVVNGTIRSISPHNYSIMNADRTQVLVQAFVEKHGFLPGPTTLGYVIGEANRRNHEQSRTE